MLKEERRRLPHRPSTLKSDGRVASAIRSAV
jgi:hypothetical protein